MSDTIQEQTTPTPLPPRAKKRHKLLGALVMVGAVVIFLALACVFWPQLKALQNPQQDLAQVVPMLPQLPVDTNTATTTQPVTTSTSAAPEGCVSPNSIPGHYFGDRITLFQDDEHFFCLAGEHTPVISVTAKAFGDSRCPVGVQCIWAGEQTVDVAVSGKGTSTIPEVMQFGTLRKTMATYTNFAVKMTLYSIDEGKGGTYAEVLVERP